VCTLAWLQAPAEHSAGACAPRQGLHRCCEACLVLGSQRVRRPTEALVFPVSAHPVHCEVGWIWHRSGAGREEHTQSKCAHRLSSGIECIDHAHLLFTLWCRSRAWRNRIHKHISVSAHHDRAELPSRLGPAHSRTNLKSQIWTQGPPRPLERAVLRGYVAQNFVRVQHTRVFTGFLTGWAGVACE
jgi:hypothetical protein